MAYTQQVKDAVRTSFIKGQSLKAAASYNSVPYETARTWKRKAASDGDDWDTARAAARISAGGVTALTAEIVEDFVLLFRDTIEEIKQAENMSAANKAEAITRLSDAYQKTVKAAGASDPKLSRLAVAMDVLQKQAEYIRRNFPHLQDGFLEQLEPFGKELNRLYG